MRYQLTCPVKDGYQFFDVYDTAIYQTVISIWAGLPGAEQIATELTAKLNGTL